MSAKQDRTYTRTASDLERKLGLKEKFSNVMGVAEDAQSVAEEVREQLDGLDSDEVFKLLTKDGQLQGIFKGEDGEIYINASYIASGIISSKDGKIQINLQDGAEPVFNTGISTNGLTVRGDNVDAKALFTMDAITATDYDLPTFRFMAQDTDGNLVISMNELFDKGLQSVGAQFRINNDAQTRMIDIRATGETADIILKNYSTGEEAGRFCMNSDGTSQLTCDKVTGLATPTESTDAVTLGFYRYAHEYKIISGTGAKFPLPETTGYHNYFGVIRPTNAGFATAYLLCGNLDGSYKAYPILTHPSISVTADDGRYLTVINNSDYDMTFYIRLINLGY